MKNFRRLIAVLIAAALAPASLLAQEGATVSGRVTNAQGQPEAAVLVRIESLNVGASSGADGNYRLVVPAARIRAGTSVTITASRTGLSPVSRTVTLSPGANLTQNFQMATSVLLLEDIVVTGTAGAVEARKVPFEVGQITAEDIPVPSTNAASALQGKVAGVTVVSGSGRPGSAPSIILRGAKSINAAGRNQEPLYIVDGVILGSSVVDIDALDIEKIEVLKGAAAASMYGSRAANGVIQITTRRGSRVADDQVRYTFRSEGGRSEMFNTPDLLLSESHQYRLVNTDSGTFFVGANGQPCRFLTCAGAQLAGQTAATGQQPSAYNTYQSQPWPGQTFDQVDRFFSEGTFTQNYVSAEGRSGATNFHVSFSNLQDEGIMPGLEGLDRNNFRVNVDQAIRSNISVGASAFYSRSVNDQFPEGNGNPLFALTRMPAGVDLQACQGDQTRSCIDRPDSLVLRADPGNAESGNPLYELLNREYDTERGRLLTAANFRYSPINWFDVDAAVSYDRLDRLDQDYYPRGFRTTTASALYNNGYLDQTRIRNEAFNGSITGTARFDLADNIHNRTQLRYLLEQSEYDETYTRGYALQVGGLVDFGNTTPANRTADSYAESVVADGYFAITNFDIADRYILDALIRNDGSSLFGPDERRQWYYRLAGAWLMSEESWFGLPGFDEFKLRYSVGTAGGRPRFSAQYETYAVTSSGISPVALGNRELRPEHSREQEAGVDLGFLNNRATLTLNYANVVTSDQILQVPLPAYTGFQSQWRNAGTLENNTWELSLDTRLIERNNFSWSARVNYDRTRSEITEFNLASYRYGVPGQGLDNVFFAREGEELGTFYGIKLATTCEDLPAGIQNQCDQFAVNDEGYLVWTGGQDLSARNWGATAPASIQTSGAQMFNLRWGEPIAALCNDRDLGTTVYCPLGRTTPDYKVGFSSTVSWGGLTVYGLLDAEQGFDVYNQPLQWAVFRNTSGLSDQAGVPVEQQKPLSYYGTLYNVSGLRPSSAFVEDGSYVKLRELSLRYTFGSDMLSRLPGVSALDGLSLMLIGRNLKTWTDYRGFDPEVGNAGGQTGSAALGRVEGYQYPNFRTWTLGVEVNF
jgi:TonB-linked SusC/RagA family outer membrane protein